MKEIAFKITGKRSLIMHNPAGMRKPDGQAKRKTIPSPEDEAEAGAYRLPSRQLYLKSEMFAGSIRKAAGGLKIGKVSAKVVFSAGLFFMDEFCPLVNLKGKAIDTYEIDTRRAVVQRQGILRSRPKISEWATTIKCEYDEEILNPQTILEVFQRAGSYIGVGDQRPGAPMTPGQFGTYTVEIAGAKT